MIARTNAIFKKIYFLVGKCYFTLEVNYSNILYTSLYTRYIVYAGPLYVAYSCTSDI